MFVEGGDVEEAVLQREQTDSAVGGFTVGPTNGPVPVFTLQSPPVEQPVEAQVFMSVYFSAIIEGGGGPQSCTRQTWADSSTTLIYSVSDGTGEIYSTEVTQTLDTSAEGDAMNFSGEVQNVTLNLSVDQSITLSVSVVHQAKKVNTATTAEPATAASCPLGEKPPFSPCSHGLSVVIMRTRGSKQPISLAKVSEAATATAAPNIHTPVFQSSAM